MPPRLTVAPPFGLGFQCVALGCDDTQTLVLSNHGDGRVWVERLALTSGSSTDFSLAFEGELPISLARKETLTVGIRYRPSDAVSDQGSVRMVYTLDPALGPEPEPIEMSLRTRSLGPAQAELVEPELNFGFVNPGETLSKEVVVRNVSPQNAILTITGGLLDEDSDPSYSILTSFPVFANAGEQARIVVRFTPPLAANAARTYLGTIHLGTNDGAQPDLVVPVLATARESAQLALVPPPPGNTLDLGSVGVGTSTSLTVVIRNLGGRPLRVIPELVNADGSGFTTQPASGQLPEAAPFATTPLVVLFTPTVGGQALGTGRVRPAINLRSNDPDHPTTLLWLEGFGVLPHAQPSVDRVDFGGVVLGWTVPPTTVLLRNTGAGPLHVSDVSLELGTNSQFRLEPVSALPLTLLPEDPPLPLVVAFNAVTLGPATGTLLITTDDPEKAIRRVTLMGRGITCQEGCPLPHASPACDTGSCQISSCQDRWHDADRLGVDGCECPEDEGGDIGHICGAGEMDFGALRDDDHTKRHFNGTLHTEDDQDVFWFFAEDVGGLGDLFGDGYDVHIDLQDAAEAVEFCLRDAEHDVQGQGCGRGDEQCGKRSFEKHGSWGSDDDRDYTVRVRLRPGAAPACYSYTLRVDNAG